MKTRRVYQKPMMETEAFVPSAYCAVCYQVACNVWQNDPAGDDGWDPFHPLDKDYVHNRKHCGNADNQVIREDNGKVVSMTEIGTDGLGDLPCTILLPSDGIFRPGMTVRWTTSSGTRTWTHTGTVENVFAGRPNASV